MTFDWSTYRGNLTWLPRRTLFICRHGSHAYGTSTPASDVDVRGIFVAPKEYVLGFSKKIEQVDSGWGDLDCSMYDLRRYLSLAVDMNPNVIELLYVDRSDWLYSVPAWEEVVGVRDSILNQNAKHRFCGYAMSQLKRMETHQRWLRNPPREKPTRAAYGLPDTSVIPKEQREALEAVMRKEVESWQVDLACLDESTRIAFMNRQAEALADMKLAAEDQYVAAGNKIGLDSNAMEHLKAERAYRAAMSEWQKYQTWLKERNQARAELEAKYGYDTKHASHLVRLMRMAREILEGRGVLVRRPDAEELLAIRNGAWPYEKILEFARAQDGELDALMKNSPLRREPDRQAVDDLCVRLVERFMHEDPAGPSKFDPSRVVKPVRTNALGEPPHYGRRDD